MKYYLITLIFLCCLHNQLQAQDCDNNSTGCIPIPDLRNDKFEGFTGGKYPNGSNTIPYTHYQQALIQHREIYPRNQAGDADSVNGKIGMMVLGYSTAAMTGRFVREMVAINNTNNQFSFIIGAQGGRDINSMTTLESTYWTNIDSTLIAEQLSRNQIQIIWLSSGDIYSFKESFPEQCYSQMEKYRKALFNIQQLYPNCKVVYLSDRTYAGYIGINGEGPMELKEPTAYYNGWTIKWLIEKQIQAIPGFTYNEIPFIDWGPYLWTDGTKGNRSGYIWDCTDAGKGGIHPSSKGRMKEAALVYLYFRQHPLLGSIFY